MKIIATEQKKIVEHLRRGVGGGGGGVLFTNQAPSSHIQVGVNFLFPNLESKI